jgi:hypothetical protein
MADQKVRYVREDEPERYGFVPPSGPAAKYFGPVMSGNEERTRPDSSDTETRGNPAPSGPVTPARPQSGGNQQQGSSGK